MPEVLVRVERQAEVDLRPTKDFWDALDILWRASADVVGDFEISNADALEHSGRLRRAAEYLIRTRDGGRGLNQK